MAKIKKMCDGRCFRKRINENGKRENKNMLECVEKKIIVFHLMGFH